MILGIDVSSHNGTLDWEKIKAAGIQFAMIRVGYGSNYESQDDKQAIRNMQECTRIGMPFGIYNYSYALNEEDARSEADHMLRVADGFSPKLGFYTDMEDSDGYKQKNNLPPEQNGEILTKFCNITMRQLLEAGIEVVGTYANKNYFDNILLRTQLIGRKWLAIWGPETCPVDWAEIWQFSSNGAVDGNGSSRMDMNEYIGEFESGSANNTSDIEVVAPIVEESTSSTTTYKKGDHVRYHRIYSNSGDWTDGLTPLYQDGIIAEVYEGARRPYLLENGVGYLDDDAIDGYYETTENSTQTSPEPVETGLQYQIGQTVSFQTIHVSSVSVASLKPLITTGTITNVITTARNPYLINGGTGWVNDSDITALVSNNASASTNSAISVGSVVKFTGSKDYTGNKITAYYNDKGYTVTQINGDRAVLSYGGVVFAAVSVADLQLK